MFTVPVVTVPRPGGEISPDNQWAFRCLQFYARPLEFSPPGTGNKWAIRFVQIHTITGDWRFLSIHPKFGTDNKPIGIEILEDPRAMPSPVVADMKFWAISVYARPEPGSDEPKRIEYTHQNIMALLSNPRSQALLLRDAAKKDRATITLHFWQGLLAFLVHMRVIGPEALQTFITKIETRFDDYNVPTSTALEHALANGGAPA